jgi:hypothetical protein
VKVGTKSYSESNAEERILSTAETQGASSKREEDEEISRTLKIE